MAEDIMTDSPEGKALVALIEASGMLEAATSAKSRSDAIFEQRRVELEKIQTGGGFGMGRNARERFVKHGRTFYRLRWNEYPERNGSVQIEKVEMDEVCT